MIGIGGTVAVADFGPNRPTREWTVQENGFNLKTILTIITLLLFIC